jgi:hypothetical protein
VVCGLSISGWTGEVETVAGAEAGMRRGRNGFAGKEALGRCTNCLTRLGSWMKKQIPVLGFRQVKSFTPGIFEFFL